MEAEVQAYFDELKSLKKDVEDSVRGLNDDTANWKPLSRDTNSIYAILKHMIGADNHWIRQVINGEIIERDRASEFHASGHLSDILNKWEETKGNEKILAKLKLSQLNETKKVRTEQGERSVSVRWCILHVISHYATHLGHIQLTRQLWEQQ